MNQIIENNLVGRECLRVMTGEGGPNLENPSY